MYIFFVHISELYSPLIAVRLTDSRGFFCSVSVPSLFFEFHITKSDLGHITRVLGKVSPPALGQKGWTSPVEDAGDSNKQLTFTSTTAVCVFSGDSLNVGSTDVKLDVSHILEMRHVRHSLIGQQSGRKWVRLGRDGVLRGGRPPVLRLLLPVVQEVEGVRGREPSTRRRPQTSH